MGSLDPSKDRELTVLVTGFAPFKAEYPVNPAWAITESLPDYLPSERTKDPDRGRASTLPAVRILKHGPVRVNYEVVRDLVPKLWDSAEQKVDCVIHIGMVGPQQVYSIERRGHRDGYDKKDVDGQLLGDEQRREQEGDQWIWHDVPEELLTDLDIENIYKRWVERTPDTLRLRLSEDAGHYLCDFMYFSSLAHLYKQQRAKRVLFFHVPLHADEESVSRGKELVLELIRSICEAGLRKGVM
ncbi:peptidase [Hypoxylon fragiforme]|uniref:peptidase n=1 Tax=Hypoxylon fragiforme TaxID=63214 RepID=UPI0020C62BDC|nr:peptidase [Hypoxylon fragiforme]KAI2609756.1 peptidase [Hypoxylon fragiforme]